MKQTSVIKFMEFAIDALFSLVHITNIIMVDIFIFNYYILILYNFLCIQSK